MEDKKVVKSLENDIKVLKAQRDMLLEYINMIDDRNSIKLQTIKSDMKKILKKTK